ncbi:hypothetical protein COV20_06135 [Candidatus Woesearchaeota archaeon CG10_big_fil_rev_8_21_14_0_10_45_16]|nr:MAG: hypothetical protein COV20_06135 [Candidatus Woesearchaeota archaeon CG10_big_fil_rev_8_21_14_0_10_45_16]
MQGEGLLQQLRVFFEFRLTSRLREVGFLRVERSDLQKFNLGKFLQGIFLLIAVKLPERNEVE